MKTTLLTDRQTDRLFDVDLNRVEWIDVAKGIAIVLVIIGHTVQFGGGTRNFIFSFHMPLFFLLSGFTYKVAQDWKTFKNHLKKGVRHLIIPCIIVSCIGIIVQWGMGHNYSGQALWIIVKQMGNALWWASGVGVNSHPAAGAIWFLFSLFWAKTIIDGISLLFPDKNKEYIYMFIGLLGLALGIKHKWLPQNLDVTFVTVLFIYLGMLWKRYIAAIQKHENILFLCAVAFWLCCLNFDVYIEMAGRSYPYLAISIIEAVAGSFAVCCFCKALMANVKLSLPIQFIGMHTLLIFLIHHMDWTVHELWQTNTMWKTCTLRIVIVFLVSFVIYIVNRKGEIYRNRRMKVERK